MDQQFNPNISNIQSNSPIQSIPPAVQPPKNTWKIVALVIIGILVLAGVVWGGYYWWQNRSGSPVACTQEAKQCSDGSYVSRTGPNCEFAECPADETANWQTYKNEKYGYEFKYPQNIFVYNDLKSENAYLANKNVGSPMELGSDGVWIAMVRASAAEGWLGETNYELGMVYFAGPKPNTEISYTYFVDWVNQDALYRLSISSPTEENLKKYQKDFNQIISTFKFTK